MKERDERLITSCFVYLSCTGFLTHHSVDRTKVFCAVSERVEHWVWSPLVVLRVVLRMAGNKDTSLSFFLSVFLTNATVYITFHTHTVYRIDALSNPALAKLNTSTAISAFGVQIGHQFWPQHSRIHAHGVPRSVPSPFPHPSAHIIQGWIKAIVLDPRAVCPGNARLLAPSL